MKIHEIRADCVPAFDNGFIDSLNMSFDIYLTITDDMNREYKYVLERKNNWLFKNKPDIGEESKKVMDLWCKNNVKILLKEAYERFMILNQTNIYYSELYHSINIPSTTED